ncbi:MAG: hypothetical protein AAGA35_01210 [Patescibacteria group bacterium]
MEEGFFAKQKSAYERHAAAERQEALRGISIPYEQMTPEQKNESKKIFASLVFSQDNHQDLINLMRVAVNVYGDPFERTSVDRNNIARIEELVKELLGGTELPDAVLIELYEHVLHLADLNEIPDPAGLIEVQSQEGTLEHHDENLHEVNNEELDAIIDTVLGRMVGNEKDNWIERFQNLIDGGLDPAAEQFLESEMIALGYGSFHDEPTKLAFYKALVEKGFS